VILNDMRASLRPLKRGTLADRARMRCVLRIARQRGVPNVRPDPSTTSSPPGAYRDLSGRNERELAKVIREEGTPRQ
jgi:hypothetical protein